jgi:predicted RNA methylase
MTSRTDYNNPELNGALPLPYHYEMVADGRRVAPFKAAIEQVCPGRVVLESGTGSAILSLLAARAGADIVYTFDLDPAVGALAKANVERSGLTNIVFTLKDTLTVTLDDLGGRRPDVVIAENLSTWQVTEPQIELLNHINRNLAGPSAIRLPSKIFNSLQLAQSEYRFEDLVDVRTHYFQFTGVPAPLALSDPAVFDEVDLREVNRVSVAGTLDVVATRDGLLNSLRLTSPLEVYDGITFAGSDSLMPPVVVPLVDDLPVRAGDVVRLEISYRTNTSWEEMRCSAAVVG